MPDSARWWIVAPRGASRPPRLRVGVTPPGHRRGVHTWFKGRAEAAKSCVARSASSSEKKRTGFMASALRTFRCPTGSCARVCAWHARHRQTCQTRNTTATISVGNLRRRGGWCQLQGFRLDRCSPVPRICAGSMLAPAYARLWGEGVPLPAYFQRGRRRTRVDNNERTPIYGVRRNRKDDYASPRA